MSTDSDRILVVDDDPGVRAALSRVLGRVGYSLLGVASGEEALDALKNQRFACGVVDLPVKTISRNDSRRLRLRTNSIPRSLTWMTGSAPPAPAGVGTMLSTATLTAP